MANLSSDRVNSFPSTKRASVNKLMTENSVTRLINRLIDVNGFIITTGLKDVDFLHDIPIGRWSAPEARDFEFVIRGYYFSISAQDNISGLSYLLTATNFNPTDEQEHTLYARIYIDKTDKNFPELFGQDELDGQEGVYNALIFYIDDNEPDIPDGLDDGEYEIYSLPIVKYKQQENKGGWDRYIPLTSLYKFSSISISNIDGGEIDIHRSTN